MAGQIIFDQGSVNINGLTAPGAYVQIIPPLGLPIALPTNAVGIVGTASWGPVNQKQAAGSLTTAAQQFGQFNVALNDPYDLARDFTIAFQQSPSAASLAAWLVRISDTTDTAASVMLLSTTQATDMQTVTVGGTAAIGDIATLVFTSSSITGSPVSVTYTLTDTTTTLPASKLTAAINANLELAAAGITASVTGSVITITSPQALSIQPVITQNATGANALTLTQASGSTGTAAIAGGEFPAIWTGTYGAFISVTFAAGQVPNTITATLTAAFPTGFVSETYPNLPNGNAFWQAFANALAQGISQVRGPSQLLGAPLFVSTTAGSPALGTFALTGGSDGRSGVTSTMFFGSDVAGARTGIYALRNCNPKPQFVWGSGLTDSTKFATLQAFTQSEVVMTMFPIPTGTSTVNAITTVQGWGISYYRCTAIKDWIFWNDPYSGKQIFVSPVPFAAAAISVLSPQLSPINTAVQGVVSTERGANAYDENETGLLESNGILAITNPVPGGYYWGFPVGNNLSSNSAQSPIEYTRMMLMMGLALAQIAGKYVGKPQGPTDPDDTRMALKGELDAQGQAWVTGKLLANWYSQCSAAMQTLPRYCQAVFGAQLLDTADFVVISLQGATNLQMPSTTTQGS